MKKQTLLLALFAAFSSFNVYASGNTYVGGSIALQDVTAAPSAFRGIRGGLFMGYDLSDDRDFFAAIEFAGSVVGTITDTYVGREDSLRMPFTLSLSGLPGMFFSRYALGYLRLGVAESLFSGNSSWRPGVILGAGLEAALSSCWSVRAEYDYTMYRAVAAGTPRSDEFGVSLKYTFDA